MRVICCFQYTTDFDTENDCSLCYSQQDVAAGEQVQSLFSLFIFTLLHLYIHSSLSLHLLFSVFRFILLSLYIRSSLSLHSLFSVFTFTLRCLYIRSSLSLYSLFSVFMFTLENLRRASKESITLIKPGENKRGHESFGGFKRKRLSD